MKAEIVAAIQRLASENGGQPLGERGFFRATGLGTKALNRAGFATYGEAREVAGFSRGRMTERHSDDAVLGPLADLTRAKGRLPTLAEVNVAHHAEPGVVPSQRAYRRITQRGPLAEQLRAWCEARSEFADVVRILAATPRPRVAAVDRRQVVTGYVYLMRYGASGRHYKIGFSEDVGRRQMQLDMMSPTDVRVLHVIATDDPRGIERYWQTRFASRQIKRKEVYELSTEDVRAFKRRKYQ